MDSRCEFAPPDTNGAVGATQYVQWVNTDFAIFNKSNGALIAGPDCRQRSVVGIWRRLRDQQRWRSRRAVRQARQSLGDEPVLGFHHSLSCSASPSPVHPDATGTLVSLRLPVLRLRRLSQDGCLARRLLRNLQYVSTAKASSAPTLAPTTAPQMLSGQAATQICFQQSPAVGGLLPSDVDGTTAPPRGLAELHAQLRNQFAEPVQISRGFQ